jgi:hypothetical protein
VRVGGTGGRGPRTGLGGIAAGVDGGSADGASGLQPALRGAAGRVGRVADGAVDKLAGRRVAARGSSGTRIAVFARFEDTLRGVSGVSAAIGSR